MVPERVSQGLKYRIMWIAQCSHIDLQTGANPVPSELQKPKIARFSHLPLGGICK